MKLIHHFLFLLIVLGTQPILAQKSVSIVSNIPGSSICIGTSVTFTANTVGFSSPSYQWYKNGVAVSGANSLSYTTSTLSNSDQVSVTCSDVLNIVTDNSLALHLDAGNALSYPGSGSTWTDLSGNNKNATLTVDHSYSSNNGGSIQFNGGNNSATMPLISNQNTNVTMQCWVFLDANSKGPFFKNGTNNGYMFGVGGGGYGFYTGNLATMLFAGARWINTNISYGYGWKFVTMVLNSSGVPSLYINTNVVPGNYEGANALVPTAGSYLGRNVGDDDVNWPKFNGKMGAAYMYSRALTPSEISQNFNASATRFGLSTANFFPSNTLTISVLNTPTASLLVQGDACANKTTLIASSGYSTYEWYKNNSIISGSNTNTYVPSSAGDYRVVLSDGTCSASSAATNIIMCGLTTSGKMLSTNSSTLLNKDGGIDKTKGIDQRGMQVTKAIAYGTVTTRTGRIWLDRNLGATKVADNSTDGFAYGDYYQWGRPTDGHEKQIVNGSASDFTTVKSSTSTPGNSQYIIPSDGSFDWLISPNNSLWTGINAPNNPCPAGFRIPTVAEWVAEAAVFTAQSVNGTYEVGYGLKLTLAGMAGGRNSITAKGVYGQYLTQTAYDTGSVKYFGVISNATWFDTNYSKITGQSCRCIKD